MSHKIGAYVRVSTEEQAQVMDGSIESQQHRLKAFIDLKNVQEGRWGKIVETYIDDGYSAKDTRRPAYQRMMKDIRSGKINLILVTDLSRLSRNIADFCGLLKDLEEHRAKFLSVKEQFDTSTPVGEMMIYNMINLAQFERKQTSERVSMNFHSRALRGLLNGGNPLLGYDKDPTNPGKLIVNEAEAAGARMVFEKYLELGSLQSTASYLSSTSIRPKIAEGRKYRHALVGRWTVNSVRHVLINFAYAGLREVNKGNKHEDQEFLKPWQRYQVVKASWPALVDEQTFFTVQKLIAENRIKERSRFSKGNARVYLLSGLLRCGDCGRALFGSASTGAIAVHRYYGHKQIVGETIKCKIKRFRADEIEEAVVTHLSEILLRSGHLDEVESNLRKSLGVENNDLVMLRDRVNRDLAIIDKDIESAFKLHGQANDDRLFRSGSMTKEVYEKIETNRQETKLRASWCNIVAPVSGTVTTHYLDSSEWVNPGAKVIALIDMNDVWTNIYVDQSVFSKLKLGMSVTGKIASDIALPVQGKIIKLNHEAEFTPKNAQTLEERSRLVHGVKIKLEQRDLALKPGMPIEIDLSILREAE